jgi:hypothetical protein
MEKVLALAAAGEASLGLVLLVYPPIVVRLLLDAEIAGAGIAVSRVAGIALIALGGACWPGSEATGISISTPALRAMLCYSLLATLYLAYLGICGEWVGVLLWPAVAIHAVLTTLLVRAWLKGRQTKE